MCTGCQRFNNMIRLRSVWHQASPNNYALGHWLCPSIKTITITFLRVLAPQGHDNVPFHIRPTLIHSENIYNALQVCIQHKFVHLIKYKSLLYLHSGCLTTASSLIRIILPFTVRQGKLFREWERTLKQVADAASKSETENRPIVHWFSV